MTDDVVVQIFPETIRIEEVTYPIAKEVSDDECTEVSHKESS
jgi:hypothetical protein